MSFSTFIDRLFEMVNNVFVYIFGDTFYLDDMSTYLFITIPIFALFSLAALYYVFGFFRGD